jgi:hypothetical protein
MRHGFSDLPRKGGKKWKKTKNPQKTANRKESLAASWGDAARRYHDLLEDYPR